LNLRKDRIMKSFLCSLRVPLCVAVFCAAFSLSCKPDKPEPAPPEPKSAKGGPKTVETDIEPVKPKPPVVPGTPYGETAAAPNEVAVTVNGTEITEGKLEAMIKTQLDRMAAQSKQIPPQFAEQYRKMLRQPIIEQMIVEQLMSEKVKAANISITEEDVNNEIKKMIAAQKPPLSFEEFEAKMKQYGQGLDDIKEQIRKALPYKMLIEKEAGDKINVTNEDARKFYDENPKKYEVSEQISARHILIRPDMTDPNTDPNEANAKARAKAEDLLKQINGGADFAELAKANSADPGSAANGGDLGFFARGRMVPPFEKAAFELKDGQVSNVVNTSYGFHIIKATGRKEAGVMPFDEVKEDIIRQLTQIKQTEFAKQYIEKLKTEAKIVYPLGKEPKPTTPPTPPRPTPPAPK